MVRAHVAVVEIAAHGLLHGARRGADVSVIEVDDGAVRGEFVADRVQKSSSVAACSADISVASAAANARFTVVCSKAAIAALPAANWNKFRRSMIGPPCLRHCIADFGMNPAGRGPALLERDGKMLDFENSRLPPQRPPSRPIPEFLRPPKGAWGVEGIPSLTPTIPYSRDSPTRIARPRSRVPKVGCEAVGSVVGETDGFGFVAEFQDWRDRPEGLPASGAWMCRCR